MPRTFRHSLPTLVMLALPTLVLAADPAPGGGHDPVDAIPTPKQGIATGVTALVVFALVAAFMLTVVWPKISKGLDERNAKILGEIEAAELARRQAKDALEEYQRNLQQARAEAAKMIEQTRAQQLELAAQLKAKADAEVAAMREKAMKDIDTAKRAAIAEIYGQTATLATNVASKILRREINAGDQQRLVEESLGQLQSMRN
ncbi:MAG: F0F1 ATP synthase subunit B [Planctomycetota bacterium]|nr:F0F1 ATP synthase subunit B [Planctomycetota bacterium]